MICMAEEMSYLTCEQCGKPGVLHHHGYWLKTLCSVHAKKLGYEKGEPDYEKGEPDINP